MRMRPIPTILLALVALLCAVLARADEPPTLTERVYLVLAAQPRHVTDIEEPAVDRAVRLREVATSVSAAVQHATCAGAWAPPYECRRVWPGSQLELAAAVLAVGQHESHYASLVGADQCSAMPAGQRCDRGKARSYWQLWAQAAPALHALPLGDPDATRVAAWAAARQLASAARFCSEPGAWDWAAAFGRYGGRGCGWSGRAHVGRARAETQRRLLAALQRARLPDVPTVVAEADRTP